jgi:hypothetical protein
MVPINDNRGQLISIAFHNYRLNLSVAEGATLIYSTDSGGNTVKGRILVDSDGKIEIANQSKNLGSLISDLISAIIDLKTVPVPPPPPPEPPPPPGQQELDEDTMEIFEDLNDEFGELLK